MADERDSADAPGETVDEGPIEALRTLRVDTSPGFLDRVRRDVERRSLAAQVFELTWASLSMVFFESVGMLFGGFGSKTEAKEESDG